MRALAKNLVRLELIHSLPRTAKQQPDTFGFLYSSKQQIIKLQTSLAQVELQKIPRRPPSASMPWIFASLGSKARDLKR